MCHVLVNKDWIENLSHHNLILKNVSLIIKLDPKNFNLLVEFFKHFKGERIV